jgi:FKBP-type peptidyl-prolyl cis-trans isomerase 2
METEKIEAEKKSEHEQHAHNTMHTMEHKQKKSSVKPLHIGIIVVIVAIVAIAAVYFLTNNAGAQVVQKGDTVSVYYTGTLTNGTVFDSNVGKETFNFTVGANEVIPGFDQGVIGMKLNETKTITIPANEAYGPVNPSLIVKVPKSSFTNQSVEVGMYVTQTTNGQQYQGVVTAVNSTTVTVDFNSPLAGQTLIFQIKLVGIKKAGK